MAELGDTREAYGLALAELAKKDPRVVALSADLMKSTKTDIMAEKFPDRFFQVGIAEANMMNIAAGLATCGKIPFASTFAIFAAGRVWEQVRNTICYSALNVKIVATHGGISVGADGSSHQCIEDIALMRAIPNMTVIIPADAVQTQKVISAVSKMYGPVYVRLTRQKTPNVTAPDEPFEIGRGNIICKGTDVGIVACGVMVSHSLQAAEMLLKDGIRSSVVNVSTIKPIDSSLLLSVAKETGAIVTVEEHVLEGGLGSAVCETLASSYPVPVEIVAIRGRFGQSGEPQDLYRHYRLMPEDIAHAAKRAIERSMGRKK